MQGHDWLIIFYFTGNCEGQTRQKHKSSGHKQKSNSQFKTNNTPTQDQGLWFEIKHTQHYKWMTRQMYVEALILSKKSDLSHRWVHSPQSWESCPPPSGCPAWSPAPCNSNIGHLVYSSSHAPWNSKTGHLIYSWSPAPCNSKTGHLVYSSSPAPCNSKTGHLVSSSSPAPCNSKTGHLVYSWSPAPCNSKTGHLVYSWSPAPCNSKTGHLVYSWSPAPCNSKTGHLIYSWSPAPCNSKTGHLVYSSSPVPWYTCKFVFLLFMCANHFFPFKLNK